jgi:hypothetical protein
MDWNSFAEALFPIGILIAGLLTYFAHKKNWKIVEWF